MANNEPPENLIEAALFYNGGAMSIKQLAAATGLSADAAKQAVESLAASLGDRGIRVVREGEQVALATSPASHEMIEKMRRDELEGPLGKAGLETIAIIMFKGTVSRADVEYIRGVNCSSILRSLMIRGLIERTDNPNDKRSFLYRATPELPAHFGLEKMEDMPRFAEMKTKLEAVIAEREALQKEAEEKERRDTETLETV